MSVCERYRTRAWQASTPNSICSGACALPFPVESSVWQRTWANACPFKMLQVANLGRGVEDLTWCSQNDNVRRWSSWAPGSASKWHIPWIELTAEKLEKQLFPTRSPWRSIQACTGKPSQASSHWVTIMLQWGVRKMLCLVMHLWIQWKGFI